MLSIVVPTLNEAGSIVSALKRLEPLRRRGAEVIVVDGCSDDDTAALARPLADRVIDAPRGRASQMNAGAAAATRDMLLFLHADTVLPDDADALVHAGQAWGRFDVRIAGRHPLLRLVASMMNIRSRLSGVCTGDQAIFVRRALFTEIGGYPDIPLMEDIALSKALRRRARPSCLRQRVTTSGRRWESRGVMRTILLMWRLRFDYWRGVDPRILAIRYGYRPR
ncbi:MAG: TIGR04283 family arsenosugar biosynthesis glycosyltransferase [Reyranellaceae bacterium]